MRIVSLLPSATETLFALGLAEEVVGVSHECDFPDAARSKPVVIHSRLPHDAAPAEIDRLVREYVARGESLYSVDAEALCELRPELVITQDLCQVCAASPDDLGAALRKFANTPEALCLNPQNLADVWRDILLVGDATRRKKEAEALVEEIGVRLGALQKQVENVQERPGVAFLEWLEPLYVGGHWVPEMIDLAGGSDVLGKRATPSFRVTAEEVIASSPDTLFVGQCGYSARKARDEYLATELPPDWTRIPAVRDQRVYALEAGGYFSRPGPRLITGIEALAKVLHPETQVSREANCVFLPISGLPDPAALEAKAAQQAAAV